jgi:hypothetical protein
MDPITDNLAFSPRPIEAVGLRAGVVKEKGTFNFSDPSGPRANGLCVAMTGRLIYLRGGHSPTRGFA